MNSTRASVHSLFRNKVQYQVPLYQRRYVWNKTNWKTLWENILDQKKLKAVGDRGHFTGPIVTRLIEKQQNRFEVIDGQQRLTTFQIIFCVIRDLCSKSPSLCQFEKDAEDHVRNDDIAIENLRLQDPLSELPEPIYKFIPTDYDNLAFKKIVQREYGRAILAASSVEEARVKVFGEEKFSHRILDTYDYFYMVITDLEEISNEIPNLLETIKNNLDLVQITPGRSQQAEKIFESVNATGRSLSEFDYLRNNLFLRADDKSVTLYKYLWFENDPDYDWSDNRLESFFQAFLMAKLGPDALNDDAKLFDVYEQNLVIPNVENEFEDIKNFAGTYKKLDVDPDMLDVDPEFKTRMQFYEDLRVYENEESYLDFESQHYYNVTVVRAFIMHLQEELKRPRSEILKVLEILESYIVRRMLVDTVTGRYAYNTIKAFFRNLCKPEEFTLDSLEEHLASGQSWISNNVVENWFKGNEYHYQSDWFAQALGFTERYIFYRIENWKRMDAGEKPLNFTAKEFPISRKRVRTLTQLSYNEDAWASLGNLTFCWENDTRQGRNKFDEKKLWGNEVNRKLKLNSEICNKSEWDLNEIDDRERELFFIFREIWKENSIIEKRREDIKKKYQVGSEVLGRVVNIVKFGVFVELELGIDGLVHVSEMVWTSRKVEPAEIVSKGESVTVKILEISEKEQRIRLSLKRMQPDPWVEAAEKYKAGSVVKGRIVELTDFGAFAELGEGIEGLIHISELSYRRVEKPEAIISRGEELYLKVIELDPKERRVSLSLKAMQPDPWEEVVNKYKVGSVVKGKIVKFTRYGVIIELEEGIRGLIYNSELAYRHIKNPEDVVSLGQKLDLKVIRLDRKARGIRLSLKQTQHDPWVEVWGKYEVGSVVRGKIVDILDRGVYVELNEEITTFIHISELAYRQIENPDEIVSVGEKYMLKVIELDMQKRRISLSLKAMQPDPWENIKTKYPVGSEVQGTVVKINPSGAALQLENGVEGVVKCEDMGWFNIHNIHPSEIVKKGEKINVKIIGILEKEGAISLSIRETQPNPWTQIPEKYKVGSIVRGKIVSLTDSVAFAELSKGIQGLIRISELANRPIEKPEEVVSVGDELNLKVIKFDPEKRQIDLSLKAASWEEFTKNNKVGSIVRGKIVSLTDSVAFAELSKGIQGLIRISELANRPIEKPEEVVSVGDELNLKVIEVDVVEKRRINLSLRAVVKES